MSYVYGPVPSRRLGRSLGVDPIPFKICDWNCVYCQLGRTPHRTLSREEYTPVEDVVSEVRDALAGPREEEIDWITILGAGEPTLHSRIGDLIREVKRLTDRPVAVITNGSLLSRPEVRRDLRAADAVMPTLDAGTEEVFQRVNRPGLGLTLEEHVEGLVEFRRGYTGKILLEVMLVQLLNDDDFELHRIARFVERIHPDEVHVGTPTRAPSHRWVRPPEPDRVTAAGRMLGTTPLPERTCGEFRLPADVPATEAVLEVIRRHPLREDELRDLLASRGEVEPLLASLAASGRAKPVDRLGTRFWCPAESLHGSTRTPQHHCLSQARRSSS